MHLLEKFHYCPVCGSPQFVENNEKSKRCKDCGLIYYSNPKAAVAAFIINKNNELLVCRRAKDPAKDTLDLPGGFTDSYETAEQAIQREVLEETGLEISDTRYCFSIPNIYTYSGLDIHTMDLFFKCSLKQDIPPLANDDAAEVIYIPINELQPALFGLSSIQKAITRFIEEYKKS